MWLENISVEHVACILTAKLIHYHSTRYHIPEGQNLIPHHRKNLKYKFSVIPVVVEKLLKKIKTEKGHTSTGTDRKTQLKRNI
jgi:hypothetical protein